MQKRGKIEKGIGGRRGGGRIAIKIEGHCLGKIQGKMTYHKSFAMYDVRKPFFTKQYIRQNTLLFKTSIFLNRYCYNKREI